MDVAFGASDVEIAAERRAAAPALLERRAHSLRAPQETASSPGSPCRRSGTYTEATVDDREVHGDDAVLVVEGRMGEGGARRAEPC